MFDRNDMLDMQQELCNHSDAVPGEECSDCKLFIEEEDDE